MLLGFQARFEKKILDKSKRHTIRAKRKRRPQPGQPCHCYVNPRQKSMRLLGRWYCVRVQDIRIKAHRDCFLISIDKQPPLLIDECKRLAIADGFDSLQEMMEFWADRLPFNGDLIHWNPDAPAPAPKKKQPRKPKRRRSNKP